MIEAQGYMDAEVKGKAAVESLERHLAALAKIAARAIARVEYNESDHLAFMALSFLSRQLEHTQSIRKLVPHRDAALVARTMLEGLCQLLWAAKDPDERALQWRAYAWIQDWRLKVKMAAHGSPTEPEREARITEALALYGARFLTNAARRAAQSGQPLPDDPYHRSWRAGTTLREMCVQAESERLYEALYGALSDWEHWGTEGLGHALRRGKEQVSYEPHSYAVAAQSLSTAFKCVLQTFETVNARLGLGSAEGIIAMRNAYIAEFADTTGVRYTDEA